MTQHDMWLTTPPDQSGDPDKTCATCVNCIEECCDFGLCLKKMRKNPDDFDFWEDALDEIEKCRVDMQEDTCDDWEKY